MTNPDVLTRQLLEMYERGFQAGADAARRECAGIANSRGEEWGAVADQYWREGDHSNASVRQGWSAGAQCIANDILKLVGQPVKE